MPRPKTTCERLGHTYAGQPWTIRPAWVGAGISIPQVHFDQVCRRKACGHTRRVWEDIVGDRSPLNEPLPLAIWLERHGATVAAPVGTIVAPNVEAIAKTILTR